LIAIAPWESPAGLTAPALSMSNMIVGNFPLKPSAGATLLYSTNVLATTWIGFNKDYLGNEAIAIENAERNLIYFSIDMRDIDGNNNLDDMLDELIIQRLNFKQ